MTEHTHVLAMLAMQTLGMTTHDTDTYAANPVGECQRLSRYVASSCHLASVKWLVQFILQHSK